MTLDFITAQKIHLIGIGGIGMSALAKWLVQRGSEVSGSDIASSEIIDSLPKSVNLFIGQHLKDNVPKNTEAIVYSQAVPADNPERVAARDRGLLQLNYAEAISKLAVKYKLIAVAGTHGKTTTAAMIGMVLEAAGLDPTVIVGSLIKGWDSNFKAGQGDYLVLEADEYARSFLNYQPDIIVITNVDKDHLDVYQDEADIISTFRSFCGNLNTNGYIVLNRDDSNTKKLANDLGGQIKYYSLHDPERKIEWQSQGFIQEFNISNFGKVKLKVPGTHMASNALAAIAVGEILNIKPAAIIKGLENYQGAWRRFEKIGRFQGAPVIADYAHHPREISATMGALVKAYPDKKYVVIFQPHQKKRTRQLLTEFIDCLKNIKSLILLDIYDVAGRDDLNERIDSRQLVASINAKGGASEYAANQQNLRQKLTKMVSSNDVLIFMGAGDIHEIARALLKNG